MKNRIFLAIVIGLVSIQLQAQTSFIEKFAEREGVSTVFISPRMFSLLDGMEGTDLNLQGLAGKINFMHILTCENPQIVPDIRAEVKKLDLPHRYELLMKINEGKEKVCIYLKEGKADHEYLLVVDDVDEFTFIQMTGKVTLKELQQIINQ